MSTQHKHKHAVAKAILFLGVVFGGLGAYIVHFTKDIRVGPLTTKGPIAAEQANLIYLSLGIVLAVLVPTILLLYFFAWKYRESNNKAVYKPGAHHGKAFVMTMWIFPTLVMLVLAFILVPVTRRLDPRKPVNNGTAPITIQVVALRWKWLFLYPEQQIATVNSVTIPKDQPVTFELTADETPMSSFWIPNLGGMLYAMTGHVNRLNLMATAIGDYSGSSAEINGAGFAGMRFTANVTSKQDFGKWVNQVQYKTNPLDDTAYANLRKPSEAAPVTTYSTYAPDLYNTIIMKYMGDMSGMDMSSMNHEGHTK
ncbi:MAG: ubiquinol oxidase subunit [Candidatus Saccharibacteria bacterium]|nr:ubiquinol oxidase subunit [Candidatus Saccharibacteria bacterium]